MAQKPIAINEAVIETVVRTFYDRVRQDAILGSIFESHIVDWESHLQNMFSFWSSVMLHTNRYNGRPMPKHVVLPIDATHFQRWLQIFQTTVGELCLEEDASLFMKKARQIAHSLEMGRALKTRTEF